MINVGAYVKGSNPKIDLAIEKFPEIEKFLRQRYDELWTRNQSLEQLSAVFA